MKISCAPWLAPFLCAGLLAATPEDPALQRKFTWVDSTDSAVSDIRRLGEAMIQKVGNNLISEVSRVVPAKGPEAGIDDLHLKQLKLPAGQPGQPQVTAVKRTSLKVRDPANLPDNADLAALMSIHSALADGDTPPKVLVQQLEAEGSAPAEWRVYRPIVTSAACLVCHGPANTLEPGVKAKLERLYPEDKATNYAINEWRGVIRVSIVAPAGSPANPKKTTP